jgi:hypothetical protein
MNEESLDKMTRMRLSGMHQAFKACIETDGLSNLPTTNWYTIWYTAKGMTGSIAVCKEGLETLTSVKVPA